MSHPAHDGAQALVSLGFSPLEADVYVYLLHHPPTTGYGVAQALGKAAAGIYKVLDGLTKKGAVVVDESGARVCRAIPFEELLAQLTQTFEARRRDAFEALSALESTTEDERVYRLHDVAQIVARARAMLRRAERVAIVDLFPRVLPFVASEVESALDRGVHVAAKLYRDQPLRASYRIVAPEGEYILRRWPADFLNLVVDGVEHMLAYIDVEAKLVYQAVYSGSPYLSVLYHSGITSEIRADSYEAAIARGASLEEMRSLQETLRTLVRDTKLKGLELLRVDKGIGNEEKLDEPNS